ncbi:MAG: Cytochrome-c peroxidase [Myxococcales bacterium]|nr:Cytochrome-c peroxidase [Myxococcales bacterium]
MKLAFAFAAVLLLGACPRHDNTKTIEPANTKHDAQNRLLPDEDSGIGMLPPAAPVPAPAAGLPAAPDQAFVTPAAVALGELLFYEPRLSSTGKLSCASCHDPEHGYAGASPQPTALGKPNLRRAPTLVNLAWHKELGWDGRYASVVAQLAPHVRGQLGDELAAGVTRIAGVPIYRAHFERVGGAPSPELATTALAAFTLTRFAGDSPWDRAERKPDALPDVKAGYALFTGRAQCSVCHTPPLYTDLRYHRLGLVALHDEGRGRVDAKELGAFKTPTLRGATKRTGFFHDGSATTLDAAIDWHLTGGIGQGASRMMIDPALIKLSLTPAERAQLGAFVRALTAPIESSPPPVLP